MVKINYLIDSIILIKLMNFFLKKCKILLNNLFIFLVRKIMSTKMINIKQELANDIFYLNKSLDLSIDNEILKEDNKNNVYGLPPPLARERKIGSTKVLADMKRIFDL